MNDGSFLKKICRGTIYLSVIFIFVFLAIFLVKPNHKSKIRQALNTLSLEERKQLELFFYNIFARHELGYTLFGDKPMSFCWPDTLPPRFSKNDFIFRLYIEGTIPLPKALIAWEKIKNKISIRNYSLIICEDHKYPSFTILINKKHFIKKFNENKDLFPKKTLASELFEKLQRKD